MLSIARIKYYLYGFLCYFIDSLLFLMPREIRRYKGVIFLIILLEGKKLQADPDQDKTLHIDPVTDILEYDQDSDTGKSKNFLTENHNKATPLPDYREGISEEYIYYGLAAIPYEAIDIRGIQNFSQGYQLADNRLPVFEIFTGDEGLKKEVIPKILKKEVTSRLQQNNNSQDFVKSIGTRSEQDYSSIPKYQAFEELNLSGTVAVQETPQIEAESEQPYSQDFISDSIDQLVIHYQDLEGGQTGEFSRIFISEDSIRDLNQFTRENSFSIQLIREDSSQNLQNGQKGEFSDVFVREGSIRDLNQFRRENSFSVQLIREDSSQNLQNGQKGEFSDVFVREGSIGDLNQFRRENSFSVQLMREDSSQNLQNQPEIQDGNTQNYKNALKILIGGSIIVGGVVVLRNLLGDDADTAVTDLEPAFVTEEIS